MNRNALYKLSAKWLVIFCLFLLAVRVTHGAFLAVMAGLGVIWALKGNVGKAFSIQVMITFMIIVNPFVLPKAGSLFGYGARFGTFFISLALASRGVMAKNRYRLPFGFLFAYLLAAGVSSAQGWYPLISYFKLINFLVFMFGVWMGAQGFERNANEVMTLRATLFAVAAFLIFGSIALIPFPGISTLDALRMAAREGIDDVETLNALILAKTQGSFMELFCGVTDQSQTLSPLLSCSFAWLICDMLFIEMRFRWPHCILIICSLPLLYMTRSRVAFVCLIFIALFIYFYLPAKLSLDKRVKKWLGTVLFVSGVLMLCMAVFLEVRENAISRWVRKVDDVKSDQRSLQEAFTSSRQSLVEMCLNDFYKSPVLGMGFQVAEYTAYQMQGRKGLVVSSPIEKGFLPTMILGEGGVIGAIIFSLFLIRFYFVCSKKKLYITIALMGVLLATNIGEANFFSPGGPGGIEWMYCIVGGYVLDMWIVIKQRQLKLYNSTLLPIGF